jgi:hypothetical protein
MAEVCGGLVDTRECVQWRVVSAPRAPAIAVYVAVSDAQTRMRGVILRPRNVLNGRHREPRIYR